MSEPVPHASGPAARYRRKHPRARDVLAEHAEHATLGERVADRMTAWIGSWPFMIIQSGALVVWMAVNVWLAARTRDPAFLRAWDPYPFILLNLVLSFQAAYTGPIVLMSQNRQADKDRLMAKHDYEINLRAEEEVEVVMQHLVHQDRMLGEAVERLGHLVGPPAEGVLAEVRGLLQRTDERDRRLLALLERLEAAGR